MNRILTPELVPANGCIVDMEDTGGPLKIVKSTGLPVKQEGAKKSAGPAAPSFPRFPEVVIYEHINFGGAHVRTNLNYRYVGDWWNDKISSIIVTCGIWRFYQHINYGGMHWDLVPGYYAWVESSGIPNDMISSFKVIQWTE